MALISVIIPVYNGEKTIKETVQSVIGQTFEDFELIIIDDGSTDSTIEIIKQFNDPRIKMYSFENEGLSASRNRGIKRSSGKYISFIDADDLWSKDKLELQLKALMDNPSAGVAYSWTRIIDEAGNFSHMKLHDNFTGNVYKEMLCNNFVGSGSNILVKRDAIENTGEYDEELTSCEDWDYQIRLARRYFFVNVPKEQVFYRFSDRNMSLNPLRMENNTIKVINKTFLSAPEDLQYLRKKVFAGQFKYLASRFSGNEFSKMNSLHSIRFLFKALIWDIKIFSGTKIVFILLGKSLLMLLLPLRQGRMILKYFKKNQS